MISYDKELRNKNKYLTIIKYLINFKYYKKTCKLLLNDINTILTLDSNTEINKLMLLNNELKLNILLMSYYFNKIKNLYKTIS